MESGGEGSLTYGNLQLAAHGHLVSDSRYF
jgi:hypothetical protein